MVNREMMNATLLAAVLLGGIAGCGGSNPHSKSGASEPLSVLDWKALPLDQKYESEILERLKRGDPKLETPEGWEAFQRTTLLPERKKDFPKKR